MNSFKTFSSFISEDKKDIIETEAPKASVDGDEKVCPKCGKINLPCKCYIDDYYDAKLQQQTPKPTKIFKK